MSKPSMLKNFQLTLSLERLLSVTSATSQKKTKKHRCPSGLNLVDAGQVEPGEKDPCSFIMGYK